MSLDEPRPHTVRIAVMFEAAHPTPSLRRFRLVDFFFSNVSKLSLDSQGPCVHKNVSESSENYG
jgi:hypothetical protein